ncbi:MAG TPA: cysteine-rich CWC family protein [Chitinophagaceae bacterium]
MNCHETKKCPRCNSPFECKPGNITQCQCYGLKISDEEKAFIEQRYEDCLCRNCLLQLKNQVELFKEKFIYR